MWGRDGLIRQKNRYGPHFFPRNTTSRTPECPRSGSGCADYPRATHREGRLGVRPLRTSRGGREEPREPERVGLRASEEPLEPEPVGPA